MLALQFGQAVTVIKGLYSSTTVYFIAFTCAAAATVLVIASYQVCCILLAWLVNTSWCYKYIAQKLFPIFVNRCRAILFALQLM